MNGCGSSGGSGISSLSKLPKASGPVLSASSIANLPRQMTASLTPWTGMEKQLSQRAGVAIGTWPAYWNKGKTGYSGPMCEAGQEVQNLYQGAVQPDMVMCFIGAMADVLPSSNLYDGNWKYFSFSGNIQGQQYQGKTKFRIVKSGDSISSFEMFNCNGARPAQNDEYISVALSGSTANLTTRYRYNNTDVYKRKMEVAGTFDSSGNWLSKIATFNDYYSYSSTVGASVNTFTQYSDSLELIGAYKSDYGSGLNASSYNTRHYAKMALSGEDTYATLALGAGSGKRISTSTWNGGFYSSANPSGDIRSWTDLGVINSSSAFLNDVSSYDLSSTAAIVPSTVSGQLNFPSEADWDCQGTFVAADFTLAAKAIEACQTQFGRDDVNTDSWVNCGSAVGSPGYNAAR